MSKVALTIAVVAALACSSCGGAQSAAQPDRDRPASARVWDQSKILRLANIEATDDGQTYRLADHPDCTAAVVMVSATQVNTYRDAGDTVATNPDGTAGVKVTAPERKTCSALFAKALAVVK